LGNYLFFFFFFSAFFIVYVWSLAAKFSSVFTWNGIKFVLREDSFKNYNNIQNSGEVYECGFSGVEEPLKKLELQFLVVSIFFILYEIEFLLLLPIFLFVDSWSTLTCILVSFSFLLVLFSYWFEWEFYLLHYYH
jgi:NADH:ubiquinone oxidoreductase subunit 3 (subunit A)